MFRKLFFFKKKYYTNIDFHRLDTPSPCQFLILLDSPLHDKSKGKESSRIQSTFYSLNMWSGNLLQFHSWFHFHFITLLSKTGRGNFVNKKKCLLREKVWRGQAHLPQPLPPLHNATCLSQIMKILILEENWISSCCEKKWVGGVWCYMPGLGLNVLF